VSRLPPLPFPPPFPVYGLADSFTGARWLDLWNQAVGNGRGPLWHVNLGHGDPVEGPEVVVITDAKLPRHEPHAAEPWHYGPTDVSDAALGALLLLVHRAYPVGADDQRPYGFWQEVKRLGELADHLAGPEWSREAATVDGRTVVFSVRRLGEAWAAVADLGPVALGVGGYRTRLSEHAFCPVNDQLATSYR
jgi:hypothetical protein